MRVTKSQFAPNPRNGDNLCRSELHTFCARSSIHMKLPYLAGVVTENDVRQKGSGSYAADFVSWAKIMQLINKHAPGWQPCVIPAGDNPVHKAPNLTAYLVIIFKHADEGETSEWPQAIMDNRNNPIPYDKVTARDITDTHRRAICSAAAAFFSLGYELWAREDYATAEAMAEPPKVQNTAPAKPADNQDPRAELESALIELLQTKMAKGETIAYLDKKADLWGLKKGGSRVQQMNVDQLQTCIDELSSKKLF